ncbi:MAG: FHA domain-containing protein [Lachnospiraceae bacterium]|jgi:hypothetical protein|nr:FHA domain-containing protein [Lachnospiraceae bacterium]
MKKGKIIKLISGIMALITLIFYFLPFMPLLRRTKNFTYSGLEIMTRSFKGTIFKGSPSLGIFILLGMLLLLAVAVLGILPMLKKKTALIMSICSLVQVVSLVLVFVLAKLQKGVKGDKNFSYGFIVCIILSVIVMALALIAFIMFPSKAELALEEEAGYVEDQYCDNNQFSENNYNTPSYNYYANDPSYAETSSLNNQNQYGNYNSVQADSGAAIKGITGMYAGASFPIADYEPIVIGRDSAVSHIVISENSSKISRAHVSISFDPNSNMYTVIDRSSNGTYLDDGTRLLSNQPRQVSRGTSIYLAKRDNTFRLL